MAKAAKPFRPMAVTANDLRSGIVVYRTSDGRWSRDIGTADIAKTPKVADKLLAAAMLDQDTGLVVEPTLIEMTGRRPASLRERIRNTGPTAGLPAQTAR